MSITSILASRRKFVAAATNHIFGKKILSGRNAADLYAELLGYPDNNNLQYHLADGDKETASKAVLWDWNENQNSYEVFKKYIPEISQQQLHEINDMSSPYWVSSYDEIWKKVIINLLSNLSDLAFLREASMSGNLADHLTYFLIGITDDQIYNNKARNRFFMIISMLSTFKKKGIIDSINIQDIYVLFRPRVFQYFLDVFYGNENFSLRNNFDNTDLLTNYADKDWGAFDGYDIAFPEFQKTFKLLGVNIDISALSLKVENAIFGYYGGLDSYHKMQQEIRAEFSS